MLSFFNPWALAGLLLLAIPVIVHIFKPRKTRRTAFTNLRWLRESQHKMTRRVQWHQILLFLFRAVLVALLVLVLARPVWNPGGDNKSMERFVVLDTSRSMNYADAGGGEQTPFERARGIAESLLASAGPGDRTTLLFASKSPRALGPLSADTQAYSAALREAQPSLQDGDLTGVLPIIRSMLGSRRNGAVAEITFITSNLQSNWSQSAISGFLADEGGDLKVKVVDVAPERMQNAWIADASLAEDADKQAKVVRADIGWAGDGETERSVYLTGLAGLPELSATAQLKPGRLTQVEIELPSGYKAESGIGRLEIRPQDAMPDDDLFLLNLNISGLAKILVVESVTTRIKALQTGLHLRAALQALSQAKKGAIEITARPPNELAPADIDKADLVILVEPDGLAPENLLALQNRVRAGGGLAIFLGPNVNVPFFNKELHNAENPGAGLAPITLDNVVTVRDGQPAFFTAIDWTHPLLANLFDPGYGDFPQTRVSGYFNVGPMSQASGLRIPARIGDSAPAIIESDYGAGRVVIFNTTANDAWSDLPRRPSFVPLLDRLISHLAGGLGRREFLVGEPVTIPIGPFDEAPDVTIKTPGGNTLHPGLHRIAGQFVIQLEPVNQPGIYEIHIAGVPESREFVVQSGRGDSGLARINPGILKQWWEPAEFETVVVNGDAGGKEGELAGVRRRIPLWPLLAGLACLVFMGEMFLVHWLCPKVNPSLAESRISGRGFLKRKEDGNEA